VVSFVEKKNVLAKTMPEKRKDVASSGRGSKRAKVEESDSELVTYDPIHFIRSHSKNNDPADIQTQVGK
jgi:hypothetical protein